MDFSLTEIFAYVVLPMLFVVVDIVGFTLAIAWWRRCPRAFIFLAAACLVLGVSTCLFWAMYWMWLHGNGDPQIYLYVSNVYSLFTLFAYVALLTAAFSGRSDPTTETRQQSPQYRYDDDWDAHWERPKDMEPPPDAAEPRIKN